MSRIYYTALKRCSCLTAHGFKTQRHNQVPSIIFPDIHSCSFQYFTFCTFPAVHIVVGIQTWGPGGEGGGGGVALRVRYPIEFTIDVYYNGVALVQYSILLGWSTHLPHGSVV